MLSSSSNPASKSPSPNGGGDHAKREPSDEHELQLSASNKGDESNDSTSNSDETGAIHSPPTTNGGGEEDEHKTGINGGGAGHGDEPTDAASEAADEDVKDTTLTSDVAIPRTEPQSLIAETGGPSTSSVHGWETPTQEPVCGIVQPRVIPPGSLCVSFLIEFH
jgi:hypothetical protein